MVSAISHPVFIHLKYTEYQILYQVLRTQMRKSIYFVVGKQTCAQQGNVPDVPNMGGQWVREGFNTEGSTGAELSQESLRQTSQWDQGQGAQSRPAEPTVYVKSLRYDKAWDSGTIGQVLRVARAQPWGAGRGDETGLWSPGWRIVA